MIIILELIASQYPQPIYIYEHMKDQFCGNILRFVSEMLSPPSVGTSRQEIRFNLYNYISVRLVHLSMQISIEKLNKYIIIHHNIILTKEFTSHPKYKISFM